MKNVYLGTDHAGFELKEHIKATLVQKGYSVYDMGAYSLDKDDDYNEFIKQVAFRVQGNEEHKGIIFGGSGQGEAIQANRFRGVRAAVFYGGDKEIVRLSREHNNANILSIGARFVDKKEAEEVILEWLEHKFTEAERHIRRNNKLDEQ